MGQTYAELYRQYLPRILNYVRLRVDGEDLAQDLTAEVFERAISKQHTLRRREAFGGWLFTIARNTVAGYYRGHRPTVSLEQAAEQPAASPSPPEAANPQWQPRKLSQTCQYSGQGSSRDDHVVSGRGGDATRRTDGRCPCDQHGGLRGPVRAGASRMKVMLAPWPSLALGPPSIGPT